MKKALIISGSILGTLCAIIFTLSFFLLDFIFMDTGVELNNMTVKLDSEIIDAKMYIDGDKCKYETKILDSDVVFYSLKDETGTHYYIKDFFGKWQEFLFDDEGMLNTDELLDYERDDFTLITIGYYEMTKEALEEHGYVGCNIVFTFEYIKFEIILEQDSRQIIYISNIGNTKVNFPNIN